ncbi:MAG: hypothetical protein AAGC57_06430 [Pseudomonadota bacterium]
MRDLEESLGALKGRWMIGGSALDQAPIGWHAMAEGQSDPDLALLALAGQAGLIVFRPHAAGDLALPRLALPPLADAHRPAFRCLRERLKLDAAQMALILQLMATRRVSVHPADWMPASVEGLPNCYAPFGRLGARARSAWRAP